MASKGKKGDRSATGKSTDNPYKHCREVPGKPNKIKCKRKRDGKWVELPKPAGWTGNNQNSEMCGDTCQKILVWTGVAFVAVCCALQPELCLIAAGAAGAAAY